SCAQTITVYDDIAPLLTCPTNITVECSSAVPAANDASVTTTDNCSGTVTVTHGTDAISNQTCANRYTITRTYTATDVCGNSASCAQTITVNDDIAPLLTCPAYITVECSSAVPAANDASVTTTDNCSGTVTVTHGTDRSEERRVGKEYTITRTYTATDVCGNSASCAQTITVNDDIAPLLTCPKNITVECSSAVPAAK